MTDLVGYNFSNTVKTTGNLSFRNLYLLRYRRRLRESFQAVNFFRISRPRELRLLEYATRRILNSYFPNTSSILLMFGAKKKDSLFMRSFIVPFIVIWNVNMNIYWPYGNIVSARMICNCGFFASSHCQW